MYDLKKMLPRTNINKTSVRGVECFLFCAFVSVKVFWWFEWE